MALARCCERIGGADQVRGEQGGDGRDRYRHRVEEVAGDFQGHAQGGDDEGELADLRQAHADPQRGASIVAGDERAHAAGKHLAEHHRDGDQGDRPGVLDEDLRIDQQADGDEEDRTEHVADRLDQPFDLHQLARLGHDRADQEGAEHHAVPSFTTSRQKPKHRPSTVTSSISLLSNFAT